ncbi:unnamed protein product [Polarella glacialis]|uniref:Ubiquitin-like domain-containing protein n=1 Tax=Polarella glacialis TaxID=89957 RepID=A0A813KG51_POLGL|nr:unnamed protein product [Polarella glacialis]
MFDFDELDELDPLEPKAEASTSQNVPEAEDLQKTTREEAEGRTIRQDEERKLREREEKLAGEEQERKSREEHERKIRQVEVKRLQEEQEKLAREEKERLAREMQDRTFREAHQGRSKEEPENTREDTNEGKELERTAKVQIKLRYKAQSWSHEFSVTTGSTILELKQRMTESAPEQAKWIDLLREGKPVADNEAICGEETFQFSFLGSQALEPNLFHLAASIDPRTF